MPQDTSANAVLTVYESILLARKQGRSWAVGDSDLRFIDEIMEALDIAAIAFRDLGALDRRPAPARLDRPGARRANPRSC